MKTKKWELTIALCAVLPLFLFSSCEEYVIGINGQGEIVEQTVILDDFNGFVSGIAADIYITQGDQQEVVIRAQQNIIDNIDLDRVYDSIWAIRYKQWVGYCKPVKIYITIPTLTRAGISGSGGIFGETPFINLDQLNLNISGSGSIDLETESKAIDAGISGSGDLKLSGQTEDLDMVVSGSGSLKGTNMFTTRADVKISGSGHARLNVEEFLRVVVSGSGNVIYSGDPELDIHICGSGTVIHGF
ncbi:MAG: head GIN domain-containing protein [Bacteroidota bacterium]